ncbi:DUF418 domain-containing protein [Luteimonas aestuarii]|uniref:DUF418 domain-containing protein n=1 Tax=Luteimonas aestuarii TaxID=453837 RepID=A0A4R5U1K8_9GAMM|nr:DUF418 domain-containing protein [Luteimonas aestuarii]TDK27500.1 DUF418 domain-containing protein [Luteimonas aestuarii]
MGTTTTRILSLDVLRGIAILGTLATNIWIFTHPEGLIGYIESSFGADGAMGVAEKVLQQASQGKFLGLLTIMFGIGLAIQRESALRAGRRWPGPYLWRASLLFLDGLLHYLLVVEFDVLMGYAVTGAVVAYVLATSERSQRAWMWTAAAIHVALLTMLTLAMLAAGDQRAEPPVLGFNPYADGTWWQLVQLRIEHVVLFRLEPAFIFFLSVALFLAGARLHARGVLEARGAVLRRRMMLLGLGVALPLDFAIGLGGGDAGWMFARYGLAPLVAFGLLALVAGFHVHRQRIGAIGRRLADVGRMALSGYVLQNILASILCYGWGFGLAARLTADSRVPATVAVFLAVAGMVMVFAHLWLRRFRRGPLEWLWHAGYRRLAAPGAG